VPDAQDRRTRTELRVDQAAAALSVLTDGRRVSVINAPAGSGKTWVLAAAGRAWAAAGFGRVIGITPSQSVRNTLAAGVRECYHSAQFLGYLPGRRGPLLIECHQKAPTCRPSMNTGESASQDRSGTLSVTGTSMIPLLPAPDIKLQQQPPRRASINNYP